MRAMRLALLAILSSAAAAADAGPDMHSVAADFERDVRPILQAHCMSCHGPDVAKGDVDFSPYANGQAAVSAAREVWTKTQAKISALEMPPDKAESQPSDDERQKITNWVRSLNALDPPDPGRVTFRRLNRAEYNNTIADLLGDASNPAASFPADDVGEGFDNIADVLSSSPLLYEKYLISADTILDKAIVTDQVNLHFVGEEMPAILNGKPADGVPGGKDRALIIGESYTMFSIPVDAKYAVKITAGADQAGAEPVRMVAMLDSQKIGEFKVTASRAKPGIHTANLKIGAGQHRLSAFIVNPFDEATAPSPTPKPGVKAPPSAPPNPNAKQKAPRVRALYIAAFDVIGPPAGQPTATHRRIMIAKPGKDLTRRDAAKQILENFAFRAYRKPPSPESVDLLMKVFDLSDGQGALFSESIKLALKAALISPEFCFRMESDGENPDARGISRVSDFDLASRLSYFLWSSMPDDELLELAKAGKLNDGAAIEAQARRLLKSPKSRALVDNFAGQWLGLRELDAVTPDAKLGPFDKTLRKAMYDEVLMFFEALMREDKSILDLIDADYTFVNDRLAKHYGMSDVVGAQMRQIQLADRNRGGVLGMAGVLTITSDPDRTSPVKRGKWVLDEILGTPPPPPPPMVKQLEQQDAAEISGLTLRQRMERHRADVACAGCHVTMDAIGFGLENFDALGRWRDKDNGLAIDNSGTLPGKRSFKGPAELKKILMERKSGFARCVTAKMLTYALGRQLKEYDDPTIDRIVDALQASDYRFSTLVIEIAKSYPFTYRRNQP